MTARANGNGQGGQPRDTDVWSLDDAIAAARAEAEDAPFRFSHNGKVYELPPIKRLPVRTQATLADGRTDLFLIEVLGQDAYDELTGDLDIGGMEALFNQWARVNGVASLPNSAPSRRPASTRT